MRIINKKYLLTILLVGVILTGVMVEKPKEEVKLDNVILKQEVNNNTFAMYIKNDDQYEEYKDNNFPEGYDLNLNKSKCIDNSGQEIENALYVQQGKIGVKSNKSFYCYLYFDLLEEKEFEYTGNYQVFIAPKDGDYEIELWGASGATRETIKKDSIGRGAYTRGTISLTKNEKIYFFVGESDFHISMSVFNGGGIGEAPGGGATDVRLNISENGNWDDFDSIKSRIMVAAGGGGGAYYQNIDYTQHYQRGDGGTLKGISAQFYVTHGTPGYDYSGHGATQISGGEPGEIFSNLSGLDSQKTSEMTGGFGKGGYSYCSSGGGGGYYGGGHGNHTGDGWPGGGGGSSFISGYEGCIAIDGNSTIDNIKPKDDCDSETVSIECSYHYSGKYFTKAVMKAGNEDMPTYDGQDTMIGNTGNGHAKIKLIK